MRQLFQKLQATNVLSLGKCKNITPKVMANKCFAPHGNVRPILTPYLRLKTIVTSLFMVCYVTLIFILEHVLHAQFFISHKNTASYRLLNLCWFMMQLLGIIVVIMWTQNYWSMILVTEYRFHVNSTRLGGPI